MTYENCYIAIPLPEQIVKEYCTLLTDLSQLEPGINLEKHPETAHITLYYMGRRGPEDILVFREAAEAVAAGLRGATVTAGGFGRFVWEARMVVFVDVESTPQLITANRTLRERLGAYSADENHETFRPHITVGRAALARTGPVEPLIKRFEEERWSFPVTEIGVFGHEAGTPRRMLESVTV